MSGTNGSAVSQAIGKAIGDRPPGDSVSPDDARPMRSIDYARRIGAAKDVSLRLKAYRSNRVPHHASTPATVRHCGYVDRRSRHQARRAPRSRQREAPTNKAE